MNGVQAALSEWLQGLNWTDFITVTFRYPRRDSIAAIRDVGKYLTRPDTPAREGWLPSWYDRAFLTAEPHRFSQNLHIHALASGETVEACSYVQTELRHRFGYTTVSPIRNAGDVAGYCAKYATKWSDGDNYGFAGDWR